MFSKESLGSVHGSEWEIGSGHFETHAYTGTERKINEYVFLAEQIESMSLYSTGEIPTITVTVNVTDKSFYSTAFPKDGDVLSLFIRGKVEPFKPIRNDYDITSISVYNPPGSGELLLDKMTIIGILRVPGFKSTACFGYRGTSIEVLVKVATDLKLGFAKNEVNTNDEQNWICPFNKRSEFIANTVRAAWKDTKTFFTYYIDHYYYLNFVNVENMISELPEFEEAVAYLRDSNDYGKDNVIHAGLIKSILSNWDDISHTQFYLLSMSLINNSYSVALSEGYKRYVQYYDGLLKQEQTLFVDPNTTPGSERDKQLLRGRPGEDLYKKQINAKWLGIQYGQDGENCHGKYDYAIINNYQNIAHATKMGLKVSMPQANFNLRRYQPIAVVIMIKTDGIRKIINMPKDETGASAPEVPDTNNQPVEEVTAFNTPFTIDKVMSGWYFIHDITYQYRDGIFTQECTLYRREWPTPAQI
jgi:hypothetical protein